MGDFTGSGATHRLIKRELNIVHIFLIVMSGTIGMGLFHNSGEILSIAGPVGGLIVYVIVGVGVICVMEGIAEMIGHWPIANAMVEFVKAFVDKDLAIVVGLAYWYAYSISFASLIISAANLASYWDWSIVLQDFMFVGGVPILLLAVNCLGVYWFGTLEVVLGALKITLVTGTFLTMCVINNKDINAGTRDGKIKGLYLDEGFQNDPAVASSHVVAVLAAIPIGAYAYAGVEIVAVTALEAKNPVKSLKYPAKLIAWITAGIYFFSALGFYMNVDWENKLLPGITTGHNGNGNGTRPAFSNSSNSTNATQTSSIVIIAILSGQIQNLAGFMNACLIMAVLSAANTALYVASRTLFGLTREISPRDKTWGWLSKLSTTTYDRKVPAAALVSSTLAFCWVPFLHLTNNYTLGDLQNIMSGIATVAIVLVWASLSLAFIRYRFWLRRFRDSPLLKPEFNHWTPNNHNIPFTTILGWAQPVPAYIGLVFCILTVFVFATAGWWSNGPKTVDVLTAFIGPIVLLVVWLLLKFLRWGDDFEWYVKIGPLTELNTRLSRLTTAIATDTVLTPETIKAGSRLFDSHSHYFNPISQGGEDGMSGGMDSSYTTFRDTGLGVRMGEEGMNHDFEVHEMRTRSARTEVTTLHDGYSRGRNSGRSPSPRQRPVSVGRTHSHYNEPVMPMNDQSSVFSTSQLHPI